MDIQIVDINRTPHGVYYSMTTGKTAMLVSLNTRGAVTTLVQNAANKAWRKLGRTFHGATAWDDALAAYKSAECRAMIQHVRDAETAVAVASV